MNEISTLCVPASTFSEKLPAASVPVPVEVPGTMTVAPMSGASFSSMTLPITVDCAIADDEPIRMKAAIRRK